MNPTQRYLHTQKHPYPLKAVYPQKAPYPRKYLQHPIHPHTQNHLHPGFSCHDSLSTPWKIFRIVALVALILLSTDSLSSANNTVHGGQEPVLVGVRVVPPFVIEEPEGVYSGLTIALWEHIASEMGLDFEYRQLDIAGLLAGVSRTATGTAEPGLPDDPAEPAEPGLPDGPAEPAEPDLPDDPRDPAEPAEPDLPDDPGDPVEPAEPGLPDDHADTDDANDPVAPALFAAASALTITAEREEIVDFTHPFFVTGLGIAVPHKPAGFWQALLAFISPEFLWIVALLALLLLFWGVLVWYFERTRNPDDFGGTPAEGIGSGFWWAAVTMTTVGYGDKAPKTFAGRLIGFVWMFAGIILISFFTASIASSLTVSQLDSRVSGPQDLPFVRVGVLEHSATIDYLEENRIRYRTYPSIGAGLQAVSDDQIDAFVHDAPIIRYYSVRDFRNQVRVLPGTFNDQYYGIALQLDSPWRNEMNRILLDFIASDEWEELNRRYLGNL